MEGKVNINLDDFIQIIRDNEDLNIKYRELGVERIKLKDSIDMLKAELLQVCIYDNNIHDEYYHNINNVGYAFHHRDLLNKYYTNEDLLKYILQLHETSKEDHND